MKQPYYYSHETQYLNNLVVRNFSLFSIYRHTVCVHQLRLKLDCSMADIQFVLCLTLIIIRADVLCFRCDRRPYGSMSQSSAPDGRYKLEVEGTDDTYIPEQLYIVRLTETDGASTFTGFMISAEGDVKQDPKNPRKLIALSSGELKPQSTLTAKYSDRCLYSVEHAVATPKSVVEVYWQAPASGNGCVTLRAMVAENKDTWYEDGSPLTLRMCEDMRQPDDVTPQLNYECQICDEAKYELTFTGIWSRNTHPRFYPENEWLPRYSDLAGASHAADLILWTPGSLATDGFKALAEYANTTQFELEIREKIGDGVRTLIKGKGHGYRKMGNPTYAFFRTDRVNHVVTAAVGLHPSPDWFLGVSRFELCQEDNTWLPERELNLYPWDAGTDNGVSYESANFPTFPQDAISRVQTSSYDKNSPFYEMDMKDLHPFGKLRIKLVKVYHKECVSEEETETNVSTEGTTTTTEEGEPEGDGDSPSEPEEPSSEAPLVTDPESSEDCPMSQWQEWSPCEGPCEGGKVTGYKWRERFHLVDGVAVEKYDPSANPSTRKEVPRFCKNHYEDFERVECEDDCDGSDENDVK
ncbi:spondin-1-like isoform X2 [Leptidea sinapis]|uniref:spondin-1-like isoform X2 n=1 Tax=Leptidea sinapis TaxID=189913 RepID=UPI0021C27C64|nr:spondin-1-like isoform X2 [Leptidea sinapis]